MSRIVKIVLATLLVGTPYSAAALDLKEAVLYVLETNPEITAAEKNKQAIEFELDQARAFWSPLVQLEARAGSSYDRGEDFRNSDADGDWIDGGEVRARIVQRLWDGYETRSEVERQAYRIDAAALRVLERSEFLGLEAVRLYAEMNRLYRIAEFGRQNVSYQNRILSQVRTGVDSGVLGRSDLQQAEESLLNAQDDLALIELDIAEMSAVFLEIVGVAPENLGSVPGVGSAMPGTLDQAISLARRNNPTVRFLQADVGASEAQVRRVDANRYPTLNLEAEARYGEDVDGLLGEVNEGEVGLVLRYEFQGRSKRAAREESVRRSSEVRADLLTQSRYIEREMRQSWAGRESVRKRIGILDRQVNRARELRSSYEEEFRIGARSLLDVVNTQGSLFQAQVSLTNAQSLETFVNYRIMANAGMLLNTLQLEPPEDAKTYAVDQVGAPAVGAADARKRNDAKSMAEWRRSLGKN